MLFDQSSLAIDYNHSTYERIEHLPHMNTNLKTLFLSSQLITSLEALLPNITSLTCLKVTCGAVGNTELNILIKTVQSLPTLQVLEAMSVKYYGFSSKCVPSSLLQLIEVADNSQLKELIIDSNCFSLLPSQFQECYRHLLKCKHKQRLYL